MPARATAVAKEPQYDIQYAETSPDSFSAPFEWQQDFHASPAKFKGFSGPVGSGKSQALCFEALRLAYENAGCTGLIGAPTFPMLRDSTFTSFRDMLEANDIPYRYLKSENTVLLPVARSKILFRALDTFERIRGTNLAWFGIDELTYCKQESWLRLEGRLRERRAKRLCGFASWTPKGFDWVYDRFIGPDKKANHEAFRAQQNPLLDPSYYRDLESSYSERFYEQEGLGEYLNVFSGQAYYAFNRKEQVFPVTHNPRAPLWWALDFNVNPMSSCIGQTVNGVVTVLDEMVLPNSNTLAACDELLERTAKWSKSGPLNIYVYGDPAGGARHTAASRTDWQIVKEFFGRNTDRFKVQFRVAAAHNPVKDRVNCVNAMLLNYAGQRRIRISPRCKELAKDFEQLAWKADPNGNPLTELDKSDPMRSHISDAFGYYIEREFPMRNKRGEMGGRPIA